MGIDGYVGVHVGVTGYTWVFMDAYGCVWLGMGTHVYVLVYMVTHGYKWVHLGIYESVWQAMDTQNLKGMYGCMWVCMDMYGHTRTQRIDRELTCVEGYMGMYGCVCVYTCTGNDYHSPPPTTHTNPRSSRWCGLRNLGTRAGRSSGRRRRPGWTRTTRCTASSRR